MKIIGYFLFIPILMSIGCSKENEGKNSGEVKHSPDLITELKTNAKDTVYIGDHTYELQAYLWRDFMPVSPPGGKPLISINTLINLDSIPIPDYIRMVRQYVIFGDSIWTAEYENEASNDPPFKLQGVSRNGPKWGPDVKVDVVSEIINNNTGKTYYIKVEDQTIIRTD